MQKGLKILSYLKNKYIIAVLVFIFMMFFYDRNDNDFLMQLQRKKELSLLQKSKAFYQAEIEKTKKMLNHIEDNPASIEKYAREHLFMKRDNEEVFIVDSLPTSQKEN